MLRRPTLLLGAALLLSLSCKPDKGPIAPDGGGGTITPGGGGNGDAMVPLAKITRAAELLPPNTMMTMDVAGPARIAEILGRDALVKEFPKEYADIVREMSEETGVDLLDPKELTGIGVDVQGRMGLAVLNVKPFTLAVYWSVSDSGRFRQFAVDTLRRQKKEVVSVPMSGAEVLRLDGMRAALVMRGPLAMFVMRDGEAKGDLALDIATTDPNLSLANDRGYRKATGGIAPADWTTYLDAGAMWARVRSSEEESAGGNNWAREELKTAKANGATPERIAELEQQAKDIDASEAQWANRRKAERDLTERLVGGAGKMVWTVSSKPGGLVGEGKLELGAEGMISKALRNHPGSPALPKALSGRPVAMFTGAMDVAELVGLLDLFLRTEGTSWTEMVAEAKEEIGVDLEAEVRPLITGTGGAAATFDGKFELGKDGKKNIGMAIDIELADDVKAKAVLDRVGKRAMAEMRKRKASANEFVLRQDAKHGAWALDFRDWRTVYVSVQGHHLVVATDPDLAKRLATGAAGKASSDVPSAALAAASLPGAAFGGLLDMEMSMMLTMAGRSSFSGPVSVEDSESAKVPKSKAYKAKLRELERARAEFDKAVKADAEKETLTMTAAFSPWGAIAGNVTKEPSGVSARGGLFLRSKGGIAGALLESLKAVKAMTERREGTADFSKVGALQNELEQIRQKDIAAWQAKHGGQGTAVPVMTPGG